MCNKIILYLLAPDALEALSDLVVILLTLLLSLGQVLTKISFASRAFNSSITLPNRDLKATFASSVNDSGNNVILLKGSIFDIGL